MDLHIDIWINGQNLTQDQVDMVHFAILNTLDSLKLPYETDINVN